MEKKHADPEEGDHLLLLEHEPVYTMGRNPDQTSLRQADELPFPVHIINRGGQATYHGPGQLVAYPIVDLRRLKPDLHLYLRCLEEAVIGTCAAFGVRAGRREGLTGVWVEDRKICSVGVGARRWVTMHGIALNVCGPLEGFAHITPCGIVNVEITSLEREGAVRATVEASARAFETAFRREVDAFFPATSG